MVWNAAIAASTVEWPVVHANWFGARLSSFVQCDSRSAMILSTAFMRHSNSAIGL